MTIRLLTCFWLGAMKCCILTALNVGGKTWVLVISNVTSVGSCMLIRLWDIVLWLSSLIPGVFPVSGLCIQIGTFPFPSAIFYNSALLEQFLIKLFENGAKQGWGFDTCGAQSSGLMSSSWSWQLPCLVISSGVGALTVVSPGFLVEWPTSTMFVTSDCTVLYELMVSLSGSFIS